jgi:hypothetical protein
MSARLEALDIDVPEKEGLVAGGLELDDLVWLNVIMLVEQKQFDSGGISREDREIHSSLVDTSTEWVGSAGLRLKRRQRDRFPNIGFSLGSSNGGWHDEISG